jgi:hypothetical protein
MTKYQIVEDWRLFDRKYAVVNRLTGEWIIQTNDKERAEHYLLEAEAQNNPLHPYKSDGRSDTGN